MTLLQNPLQQQNDDALRSLREHSKTSDNFKIKLKRLGGGNALPQTIAHFLGAQYKHFASPERWVDAVAGGGQFALEAIGGNDGTDTPLGPQIFYASSAPVLPPNEPIMADVVSAARWEGPSQLLPAPEAARKAAPKPPAVQAPAGSISQVEADRRELQAQRDELAKRERELEIQRVTDAAERDKRRLADELKEANAAIERERLRSADMLAKTESKFEEQLRALRQEMRELAKPAPAPAESGTEKLLLALLETEKENRRAAESARADQAARDRTEAKERQERLDREETRRRDEAREDAQLAREREERLAKLAQDARDEANKIARESQKEMIDVLKAPKANPQFEAMGQMMDVMTNTMKQVGNVVQMATDLRSAQAGPDDANWIKGLDILANAVPSIMDRYAAYRALTTPRPPMQQLPLQQLPQYQAPANPTQPQQQPPATPTPPVEQGKPLPPEPVPAGVDPLLQPVADKIRAYAPPKEVLATLGDQANISARSNPPGTLHLMEIEDIFNMIRPALISWFQASPATATPYGLKLEAEIASFQEIERQLAEKAKQVPPPPTQQPPPAGGGSGPVADNDDEEEEEEGGGSGDGSGDGDPDGILPPEERQ